MGLDGLITEFPVVHDLEADIVFSAVNSAVRMGCIPPNAIVDEAYGDVQTVFNAGTNNVLEIVGFLVTAGKTYTGNPLTDVADFTFLPSATFAATGLTATPNTKTYSVRKRLSTTQYVDVYVRYQPTGTAATTGAATAVLKTIPNRRKGNA